MEKKIHNWEEKLKVGECGEEILDNVLSKTYDRLLTVNQKWQNVGIDRIAYSDDYQIPIEYKTDFRAGSTGNIFLETIKNIEQNKPGWAKTTLAQLLYYYIPPLGLAFELQPVHWKTNKLAWKEFRTAKAYNETYSAEGILVPIDAVKLADTPIIHMPIFGTEYELIRECEKNISE